MNNDKEKKLLKWEVLESDAGWTKRAKVPGGWFVRLSHSEGVGGFFYPDPAHSWDGTSLD
jgi:hypothetical protein